MPEKPEMQNTDLRSCALTADVQRYTWHDRSKCEQGGGTIFL